MTEETIHYHGWEIATHWDANEGRWIAQAQKPPEYNLHGLGITEQVAIDRVKGKIDLTHDMGS